jgi:hypothetical protein
MTMAAVSRTYIIYGSFVYMFIILLHISGMLFKVFSLFPLGTV